MSGFYMGNIDLQRRGGSTFTDDGSPVPTTPPASTHSHFGPIVPKIGGSEGGFIGLVVGLGVIIIGSCIGVFFLLRHRKHGGRTMRGKSGELGVEAPPAPGAPRRRGTLFGWRSQNPKNAGFVRANAGEDEDEWDASDNLHAYGRESVQLGRNYGQQHEEYDPYRDGRSKVSDAVGGGKYDSPYAAFGGTGVSSTSSVRLVAPGGELEHGATSDSKDRPQFKDPFHTPTRSTFPVNKPPAEGASAHQPYSNTVQHGSDSRASIDSATTVTSFPGGTKFRESL